MPLAFLFALRGHVALEQVAHVSDAPAFLFALRGVISVHVAAKGSAMPSRFVCPAGIRTLLGGAELSKLDGVFQCSAQGALSVAPGDVSVAARNVRKPPFEKASIVSNHW